MPSVVRAKFIAPSWEATPFLTREDVGEVGVMMHMNELTW